MNRTFTSGLAAVVFIVVAGITGHFLWSDTASATEGAEPLVTVVSTISPSGTPIELPAPTRPATEDGYDTEAEAAAECSGTVEPLYSRGAIRGWTCTITIGGGG